MAKSQDGTKFLHFRDIAEDGTVNPRGGLTIAYRPEVYDSAGNVEYRWAEAKCHGNDNFVKAVGRAKAGGRLNSEELSKSSFATSEKNLAAGFAYTARVVDGYERKFARSSRSK